MNDDLISREALRRRMYHESFEVDNGMQRWDSGLWIRYKIFENVIEETPAVDFAEVVRCKDCKWFNEIGCAIRIVDESDKPREDDFCSFGERMEDNDGEVYQSIRHQEGVRPVPRLGCSANDSRRGSRDRAL